VIQRFRPAAVAVAQAPLGEGAEQIRDDMAITANLHDIPHPAIDGFCHDPPLLSIRLASVNIHFIGGAQTNESAYSWFILFEKESNCKD
jgi:hypothetical protein